jgi:uridine kinase
VIRKEFVPFLPLLAQIDRMRAAHQRQGFKPLTIAIEGGSASGKSTLGEILERVYDCTMFHMDDFFLRPEQRTPERFAEPGGNVDRERFLEEVLEPLSKRETVAYRRFDCSTFTVLPPEMITPKPLTIIEGAYSMHPELSGYYDFSAFLDVDPEVQKKRIGKRNSPEMAKRFFEEWIPLEHVYFEKMQVKERCDLLIPVKE